MRNRCEGPWKVELDMRATQDRNNPDQEYLSGYNIVSNQGEIVGCEGILPDDKDVAYLIAAAPTMLKTLREIDQALTELSVKPDLDLRMHLDAVRRAIEAAKIPE